MASQVMAGFPSPAEDFLECGLDLNDYLIKHPAATFFVRVEGDSMVGAGIHTGDILIVDRSLEPRHNSVVIAVIDGDFTVKKLKKEKGKIFLMPENENYSPIELSDQELIIWGVVTNVIHEL